MQLRPIYNITLCYRSANYESTKAGTTFAKRISEDPLAQQTEQTVPKVIIRKLPSTSRKNQCATPTKEDVGLTESSDKIVAKRRGLDALEKAMEIETTRSLKDCKIPNEDGRIAGSLYKKGKSKLNVLLLICFVLHLCYIAYIWAGLSFLPNPILLY